MKRSWWIAAPLAWTAVVAIVALAAWWVIDDAGRGILAESAHDAAPSGATTPTAVSSGGKHHRPTDPTTAPPSTAPAVPATSPATEPASEPPVSAATTPPSAPHSTDQGGPVQQTRTWQGEAGILRVSCTGSALRLEGASPNDGYVVDQTEAEGGRELEVKFRSTDGEREVQIHAVCSGGIPHFTVEQSGGEGDG